MRIALTGRRNIVVLMLAGAMAGCGGAGTIDQTSVSPISNEATFATLGYLWDGVRSAIVAKREPAVGPFNLVLHYEPPCSRGGSGSYKGSVTGTKTSTGGTGTLSMTATISACQYDDNVVITTITASDLTATGTIAIVNDTWGNIDIHMVATNVTVNGVVCPGGVDVHLTGLTPSTPPISTGTACGRTGAVPLP